MSDSAPAAEAPENAQTTAQETVGQVVNEVLKAKNEEPAKDSADKKPEAEKKDASKEVEPKKEDAKLAAKFAALSKKDKEARAREKALEAREKALAEKEKSLAAPKQDAAPAKEDLNIRMRRDPFGTMREEWGLDLDVLTKIATNQGKLTPEMQLKLEQETTAKTLEEKIKALEKRLEDEAKTKAEREQQAQQEAAIKEFKGSIGELIKGNAAEYELLGLEEDPAQIVYEVIEAHYEKTKGFDPEQPDVGRILDIKEAADLVESHLFEEAKKYTSLSKIKGIFAPKEQPKAASEQPKEGATKTLSNEQTGSAPAAQKRALTREEEFAEAAKLIKFNS